MIRSLIAPVVFLFFGSLIFTACAPEESLEPEDLENLVNIEYGEPFELNAILGTYNLKEIQIKSFTDSIVDIVQNDTSGFVIRYQYATINNKGTLRIDSTHFDFRQIEFDIDAEITREAYGSGVNTNPVKRPILGNYKLTDLKFEYLQLITKDSIFKHTYTSNSLLEYTGNNHNPFLEYYAGYTVKKIGTELRLKHYLEPYYISHLRDVIRSFEIEYVFKKL
jgi:hypothetical protein